MGIRNYMISIMLAVILFFPLLLPKFQFPRVLLQDTTHRPAGTVARPYPATFAYLISASKGDADRLKRTLRALYHPGNYYLLHMDYGAPAAERREVADFVALEPIFQRFSNVWVVERPSLVTYRGPTMLATTLHGMAMLLRMCQWDWFINLSASDYPLVTQDDLIHAFAKLPKDVNFIQHSSHLGWKLSKRGRPIIIDPGLYSLNKSEIWWVIKQRALPTSFKLFTGSAWTVLSRSFAEYCTVGWENLPRTLLLYFTNVVSSPEFYFQTLICNSKDYYNHSGSTTTTTLQLINHDLHYISWDNPPKQHPRYLGLRDYRRMVLSGFPFARKFKHNDRVLNHIDRDLLKIRRGGGFASGGWLDGSQSQPREDEKHRGVLRPGPGSRRLWSLLSKLLVGSSKKSSKRLCK